MDSLNFDPDDLIDLLERLRLSGFKIGAGQHISAQNLLILLASRGYPHAMPHGLGTWLAPVLCSSSEEQATFYKLFEEWLNEGSGQKLNLTEKRKGSPREERPPGAARSSLLHNKWLWRSVAAAAVIAIVITAIVYWPRTSGGGSGDGSREFSVDISPEIVAPAWAFGGTLGLLALVIGGWWLWKAPRGSQLIRWRTDDELPLERLSVKGVSDQIFSGSLHGLRRHKPFASSDIEINSTVDATARNVGWFTPVYSFRKVTPEYLMMIDRAGFGDQQASFGEVLCMKLRNEGVIVARYFFHADPRLCRRDDPASPHLILEDLVSLHPEQNLIIFGDGEGLLDPLTGQPAQWLDLFSRWPTRVLLTPLSQHLWGYREQALGQEGFLVFPANSSGLAALAEKIMTGVPEQHKHVGWKPKFPDALRQRPERWLIDEAPAPDALKKLRFQLRLFLGGEGYQWLCACAVYPVLLWDLTVYLGHHLKYQQSFEEGLSKLVQLPWFRYGVMPDWLRLQLISDLDTEQEHDIRQALIDLLISCTDGVCDPIELEILLRREEPQARRAQGNKLLHDYVKAHPESQLRDYVLLTFMLGRKPDRLAVDVPAEVLDQLHPQGHSKWLFYVLDAVLLAEAYFILLITSIYAPWAGFALGLLAAICNVIMVFQLHEWGVGDVVRAWRSTKPRLIPEEIVQQDEKHPKGLYVLFATEMWERFSFYSMLAMFALYMRDTTGQGFAWSVDDTQALVSNYLMFVYASPLIGGWIADRKIGYRRAVMIGGLFFMAGHLLLSVRAIGVVYAALTCLVIGNGFFKPNVSAMVGNLYTEGSHLKDRAYSIFYMGINVGAFLAPVVMEIVQSRFGYHPAFAVAAGGMLISVLILWRMKRYVEMADRPGSRGASETANTAAVTVDAPPASVSHQNAIDAVPDWKRIGALIVIFLIVIVFWMVFHQNSTTITYWGDENTDWKVSGIISNSINPGWVLVLTFPLVWFWGWLDRKGLEPSTPTKMVIGMVMTSLAFFVFFVAAKIGEASLAPGADPYAYKMSPMWLLGAYGVLTLGELMLSPMGLSLVSKVAPIRMRGVMMGGWLVATAIGNKLTQIGQLWDDWLHSNFFALLGTMALATAVVLFVLIKSLKRAMPDV